MGRRVSMDDAFLTWSNGKPRQPITKVISLKQVKQPARSTRTIRTAYRKRPISPPQLSKREVKELRLSDGWGPQEMDEELRGLWLTETDFICVKEESGQHYAAMPQMRVLTGDRASMRANVP